MAIRVKSMRDVAQKALGNESKIDHVFCALCLLISHIHIFLIIKMVRAWVRILFTAIFGDIPRG